MEKFDSNEELYFSWYLDELKKAGYIVRWERNDISFQLTTGLIWDYIKPMKRVADKELTQTLFAPSKYTPDFNIYWEEKAEGIFVTDIGNKVSNKKIETPFISNYGLTIVETKGDWDQNNMTRLATNNIKMVWELHEQYVQLIKIPSFFGKTFTPSRYLFTDKTMKPRKMKYKNVRTISQFIIPVPK